MKICTVGYFYSLLWKRMPASYVGHLKSPSHLYGGFVGGLFRFRESVIIIISLNYDRQRNKISLCMRLTGLR